jgi:4-amino-4-deoxy-L-arabinose transferase-like glycosyltransferase
MHPGILSPIPPRPRPRRAPPDPRPWLLLFAAALALRVAYVLLAHGTAPVPSSDAATYHAVAANLARGAGFALGTGDGTWPTAFVPPAVPGLTSLLYRVSGPWFLGALLLQCVIGALVPLALAAFGAALFGAGVGRLAGWLATVQPLLVFFSGYLLTETTFTLALLLALLVTVEWVKAPRGARALGAGLVWGLAALTRPTALPLPLLVTAWAWVPLGLALGGRARARQLALLLLGVALAVGPWTLRNAVALRAFVPVTTGGGRALLDGNNPLNWTDPAKRGGGESVFGREPYASRFRGRGEPEVDALARAEALAFLRAHAAEWPAMAAVKLGRFWRLGAEGGGTGSWQREGSPLRSLQARFDPLLAWSLLALPLALWGLGLALRGPRRLFLSLPLLVVLAFSAMAVMFWGALRMRVPIEPLVTLFAAAGADDLWRRLRPRARGLRVVEGGRPAA